MSPSLPGHSNEFVLGAWIDPLGHRSDWIGSPQSLAEPPATDAPKQQASILVCEDDHLVALDIQLRLESFGHRPVITHSGESAIEKANKQPFDLVLMDIKLSGAIDGIEAAHAIRDAHDIPIVYLTAFADSVTLDRARVTEPYGYLVKPFQANELKAAIEMALQRHGSDKHRWEQQQLQHFLADASSRMASTLDYEAVAQGACDLIVPRYADWCAISLREYDDLIPAYMHVYPGENGSPIVPTAAPLIESVQQRGRAEIVTQIQDTTALAAALGTQHLDVLQDIGAQSVLCVPLVARGQVLGALTLVSGRGRARFGTSDLAFVDDFAQRLGMALDNALLYRKAEYAIRMRDDVLAIVSHDLRSPLGAILIQADTIAEHAELANLGRGIAQAAHRMDRLIGDLLDASAINAGQLTLDWQRHSITEVVREAIAMHHAPAAARGVALVEELPAELNVWCDRDRIVQAVSNLIGNAIKFTTRGGTVWVTACKRDDKVHIEVRDTGKGIPPEHLPHLFERFWRARGRRDGAGLGLFIVRGIVSAHGDSLEVDSLLGQGTTFSFDLPIERADVDV